MLAVTAPADLTTARLWSLSVDGLLVISTAGLLRGAGETDSRGRFVLRAATILVAGWSPVALLLAVELVGHQRYRDSTGQDKRDTHRDDETKTRDEGTERVITLGDSRPSRYTAARAGPARRGTGTTSGTARSGCPG